METFSDLWAALFGKSSRLWIVYIVSTVLIAFVVYLRRREGKNFINFLTPKSIWLHPSHIVDVKIFFATRGLAILAPFKAITFAAFITSFVDGLFPEAGVFQTVPGPLIMSFMFLIVGDLAVYIVHRTHHEVRILWPFHSVHHSAEVMTPITVYRKHPMYDLTKAVIHGMLLGIFQGILAGLFPGQVNILLLVGVNIGYFLFNFFGANFRHSHIWISYGRVMEHILISPAQHQIHHSTAPEHFNKNYGEVLAIWDWMFGTLYVTNKRETLEYGITAASGNRAKQRHDGLIASLIVPFKDSWTQVQKLRQR